MGVAACVLAASLLAPAPSRGEDWQYPISVAAGTDGTAWVADKDLPGIWRVKDGAASLFFQGSKKFRTPLNAARCVAVDPKGRLLAGDSSTRDVYRFSESGVPEPLSKGKIGIPMSIAFGRDGAIYVSDLEIHRIVRLPEAGGEPEEFVELAAPRGLAMDDKDRLWAVVQTRTAQLVRVLPDKTIETVVAGRPFQFAHTVAFDDEGTPYVCDNYACAIWKVSATGQPEKWVSGPPLVKPVGLCWQQDHFLVADPWAKQVFRITKDGTVRPLVEPKK